MISVEEEKRLLVPMSREQHKRGKQEKGSDGAEKVIVAVKASKEIPKTALVCLVSDSCCSTWGLHYTASGCTLTEFWYALFPILFYTRCFSLNQLDPILLSWILFCLPI